MNTSEIRTLFITREIPYPIVAGVSLRLWQNINIMIKFGPVGVFSAVDWNPVHTSLPGVEVWKHCNVLQQRSPWEKFIARFWWFDSHRHSDADWVHAQAAAQELQVMMTQFQPDLVVMEQVWLYPYLKVVQEHGCEIIFDNHNVEASLWQKIKAAAQGLKAKLKTKIELAHLQVIEQDFSRQANQTWVCSQEDASLMQQLYSQLSPIKVIPNGINIHDYDLVRSGECTLPPGLPDKKRTILFVGQLSYPPNTAAVELLINQIYPKLKKKYPDSHLLLVGRKPMQFMKQAAKQEPGIIVTGAVPDIRPYLAAASMMVVPLHQGGGTRLKIVEALAAGCPVISTTKGAEGLKVKDGEHLLIRNEVEEIVAGIYQLWTNPDLGVKLANSGYKLVEAEYSWEAVGRKVELAIQELRTAEF